MASITNTYIICTHYEKKNMSNKDDFQFFESYMSNCKISPASMSLVMDRLTCVNLQKIAKSLHMTKFYNKRKADLIFQIIEYVTTPPHYTSLSAKNIVDDTTDIEHSTFSIYEAVNAKYLSYLGLGNSTLRSQEEVDISQTIVTVLQEHMVKQEISFNNRFPACIDNDSGENITFGRSETGCKPGWIPVKQDTGCWTCRSSKTMKNLYLSVDDVTNASKLLSVVEQQQVTTNMRTDEEALNHDIHVLRSELVPKLVNGKEFSTDDQLAWIMSYASNVQQRMMVLMEVEFQSIITIYDVDTCSDANFEKDVNEALRKKETWVVWFQEQLSKGVNIIGYILKILFKLFLSLFGKGMKTLTGAWSIAKTFAHVFVFHPRAFRITLFIIRRQQKKMCKWLGEYMVKEKFIDDIPATVLGTPDLDIFERMWDFGKGTGVLDSRRLFSALIDSNVIKDITQNAGKHTGTLVGGLLSGFPVIGPGVAAISSIIVDVTTETLTEATKMELEAQIWSDDIVNNVENMLALINPMECVRNMPAVEYSIQKRRDGYP